MKQKSRSKKPNRLKQKPNSSQHVFASPLGKIKIEISDNVLLRLSFVDARIKSINPPHPVASKVKQQLTRYFKGEKHSFAFPMKLSGTPFQQQVWMELIKIPLGEIVTYGDLAKKLKTSARAVGNACRKNPIPIIIPCHRVVAKNSIGGYSGKTSGKNIKTKKTLLAHDKKSR